MAEPFTDARLEAILMSVGEHLVTGIADSERRSPVGSQWPRRLAIAAAIVVAMLVVGTAIAPVREAVADWLGIGSTRIVRVEDVDVSGLPSIEQGLTPISVDEAEAVLRRPLPAVDALGAPSLIVASPEGGVILGWPRGETTLWVHREGIEPELFVDKLVAAGASVERVSGLGNGALLLEGSHILDTPGRRLAARSVVLWLDDGIEHRLESNLPAEQMIEIARSVEPGG